MESNVNSPIKSGALFSYAVIGASIGLSIIAAFLYTVRNPSPSWGSYWMLRPIITSALSGFTAGIVLYLLMSFPYRNIGMSLVGKFLGLLLFFALLWAGMLAGLAGTFWH